MHDFLDLDIEKITSGILIVIFLIDKHRVWNEGHKNHLCVQKFENRSPYVNRESKKGHCIPSISLIFSFIKKITNIVSKNVTFVKIFLDQAEIISELPAIV